MGGRGGSGPTSHGVEEPKFEWDPAKSASNKEKHGIDFGEATVVWQDPDRATVASRYIGESRQLTIAPVNGKMFTVVSTTRAGVVRIISARRSHRDEEARYGGSNHD